MIPMRDIVAWRQHAPWPNDAWVEQDYLLSAAMKAIFSDPFLAGQVAMRGGTALHKVHLAPAARYSEDIDLVIVGNRPESHIKQALKRVLTPVLGQPKANAIGEVVLAVRNLLKPSRVIRQVYRFRPTVNPRVELNIKIEANCNERAPFYQVVDLDHAVPPGMGVGSFQIRSYDIDEMLGTKMRALFQRDQGRDLFDLWWALTQPVAFHQPEPSRIIEAFQHYMQQEETSITFDEFAAELDRKRTVPSFRTDMNSLLRPDLPPFDVDAGAVFIQDNLLSLLNGHMPSYP